MRDCEYVFVPCACHFLIFLPVLSYIGFLDSTAVSIFGDTLSVDMTNTVFVNSTNSTTNIETASMSLDFSMRPVFWGKPLLTTTLDSFQHKVRFIILRLMPQPAVRVYNAKPTQMQGWLLIPLKHRIMHQKLYMYLYCYCYLYL